MKYANRVVYLGYIRCAKCGKKGKLYGRFRTREFKEHNSIDFHGFFIRHSHNVCCYLGRKAVQIKFSGDNKDVQE